MNGDIPLRVSLRAVSSPPPPRAVSGDDWPALRTALNSVFRPAGGDLTVECPLLFQPKNRGNLRVIDRTSGGSARSPDPGPAAVFQAPADGSATDWRCRSEADAPIQILSHAGFVTRDTQVFGRKVRVACVGAVATVPAHRGCGLGSRVFAAALGAARRDAELVMVSGDRGLYRRQGLKPVPPLARFRISPGTDALKPPEIRQAGRADLKSLAALYDAEDVHFVRSTEDWGLLWSAGRLVDAPGRCWMVSHAGRDLGYLVVQQPSPAPDGSVRPRRILEVAGDWEALVRAAPAVADELLVPLYDSSTVQLCEGRGWPRTTRDFSVTADGPPSALVTPWYGLNYV